MQIGKTTCASCKHYLLQKKDNRFITTKSKVVRGEILITHLCERTYPKEYSLNLRGEYGILRDLISCELYELDRP